MSAILTTIDRPSWHASALCAQTDHPDLWFPDSTGPTKVALQTCRRCPVRQPCLQWALDHDERFGLWGGLNADQRARKLGRRL